MKSNIKKIESYVELKRIEGITEKTIKTNKCILNRFEKTLNKSFKDLNENNILEFLKEYKTQGSKKVIFTLLKSFLRYYHNLEYDERLPDCIRRIKIKKPKYDDMNYREKVISENEYLLLINYSEKAKHKALFETLFNFGLRKSELRSIKSDGVKYEDGITKIMIMESKTKTRESIYEGRSEHLLNWSETLNPYRNDKNTYLFYGNDPNKKYCVSTINGILNKLINRIPEINRKITVHDFRHTNITNLRGKGVKETHIESNTGLVHGSRMMEIYDHNKIKDYENFIKEKNEDIDLTYPELKNKQQKVIKKLENKIKYLEVGYEEFTEFIKVLKDKNKTNSVLKWLETVDL